MCPRNCNIERNQNKGYCGETENLRISKVMLHHWEEPYISGKETDNGSGAIFFTGCNLNNFLDFSKHFEDARISSTTFTYTGEYNAFHSTDGTHPQGVCLKYETDSGKTDYVRLVLTDEQRDTLTNGMEITVEGKLFRNDDDTPYSASTKLEVETIK